MISTLLTSFITALCLSLISGYVFIAYYKHLFESLVRDYVPERHKAKNNTPTMGGLLILGAIFVTSLFCADFSSSTTWIMLLCLLGFGAIGAYDDWCKITGIRGIKARAKFLLQCTMACLVICSWLWFSDGTSILHIPYFDYTLLVHPLIFMVWAVFVIVAMSNAVNLTDGLDGLAIGSLIPNFVLFSVLCYYAGHQELCVVGSSILGACLGFLWYNIHPARMFMGDVGSLSLGAGLACMALMIQQELLLLLSGIIFVTEVLSVIMQVLSYKLRSKRIFRMAPIHHHFELSGWKETQITLWFSVISGIACGIAFLLYRM